MLLTNQKNKGPKDIGERDNNNKINNSVKHFDRLQILLNFFIKCGSKLWAPLNINKNLIASLRFYLAI
jgi:hypothetical protein